MNFTELYKKNFSGQIKKMSDSEIKENPILAFVHGISEEKIKQVLLSDDWSPSEVSQLLRDAREAKDNMK